MTNASQPPPARWTEAKLTRLVELWNARLSAEQIAGRIGDGVTRSAVVGKLFRMGLTRDAAERYVARAEGGRLSRRRQKTADEPALPCAAPPALAADAVAGGVPGLVGILELTPSGCRWPYAMESQTLFCGHAARARSAYCAAHHARAYEAVLPPLSEAQIDALAGPSR